jgi:hypothetical protein
MQGRPLASVARLLSRIASQLIFSSGAAPPRCRFERSCWTSQASLAFSAASSAFVSDAARCASLRTAIASCGRVASSSLWGAAPHSRVPLLNRGSYYWLPNRDQMSYSACKIGPSASYWFQ